MDNEAIVSATAGGAGVSATATFESSNADGTTTDDSAAGGAGGVTSEESATGESVGLGVGPGDLATGYT